MRELKIGAAGVRGVVGDGLTPELIVDFAAAFGTWADGGPVVIARDTRRSSAMLRSAVVSGLLACGCEVIDLDLAPTPLLSFAVRELGAAGGISITGSHNDARWNALKFLGPDGPLLNAEKSEELLDLYHARLFLLAGWDDYQPLTAEQAVSERYLDHLLAPLDIEAIRAREFKLALDFNNGATAPLAERFLSALGCRLFPFNEEPSGDFAHAPAPTAANMRQLATLTRCLEADLGAAVNVDGDRLGFVTGEGVALSEEYALPLAARHRLSRRLGPVVTNQSSSRMVEQVAAEQGQAVIRTAVGEQHVIDRGLTEDAVLAGEGSGGVAMLPPSMTFDALLTLGQVLESMAVADLSLAEMIDGLPRLAMRKGVLACPPDVVYRAMDGFRQRYVDRQPDESDGIRVDLPEAWVHIRASNTEPLLRVIAEAETAARAEELFDDAMTYARRVAFGHEGG